LPSEASIARLKLQAFVKEVECTLHLYSKPVCDALVQGRWRGKIHGMIRWIAGDSAANAVVQVALSELHHQALVDILNCRLLRMRYVTLLKIDRKGS
jgi:hypothetical protein